MDLNAEALGSSKKGCGHFWGGMALPLLTMLGIAAVVAGTRSGAPCAAAPPSPPPHTHSSSSRGGAFKEVVGIFKKVLETFKEALKIFKKVLGTFEEVLETRVQIRNQIQARLRTAASLELGSLWSGVSLD